MAQTYEEASPHRRNTARNSFVAVSIGPQLVRSELLRWSATRCNSARRALAINGARACNWVDNVPTWDSISVRAEVRNGFSTGLLFRVPAFDFFLRTVLSPNPNGHLHQLEVL